MSVIAAPSEWVESVGALRFPSKLDDRMQQLMTRHNDGQLSSSEQLELESLVEMSETLSLVRAKALLLLGRSPK
jgi:hypothetical protein